MRVKKLGTTTVEAPLGKGGMAEVYRGLQTTLDRPVAIKALLGELSAETEGEARFRREALALARLQHQNIVAVHDLVKKNGRLYLLLELVDGVDLDALLGAGPLPVDVTVLIASELAAALEHAHFRKVIHRDIKPANVMLSRTGQVKLTDFGIAKDQTLDDLTREGLVVGTLSYLSPEQLLGKKATPRSDLWALGALMFRCLAGRRAFAGASEAELMMAIVKGQRPRLRRLVPRVPRVVERIVDRCLSVDADKRYARAADLRRDLDRLLAVALQGSREARVMDLLRQRDHLGDIDATVIDADELAATRALEKPATVVERQLAHSAPPGSLDRLWLRLGGALVTMALVLGLVALGLLLAPEQAREGLRALEQIIDIGW